MRILVLQSGGAEHFLAAARAVAARYPTAELIGVVRASDEAGVKATGCFRELYPVSSEEERDASLQLGEETIDLCVVPFESRLGVYNWRDRRIPICRRIPRVASYNGRGRFRLWTLPGWWLGSVVCCVGVRAIHKPMLLGWLRIRRYLDIAGLFGLALLALLRRGAGSIARGFGDKRSLGRLPDGRRRLILFIPTMGMGGAQRQMVSFLSRLDRTKWDPELLLLDMPDKFFEPAVRSLGVPVTYLNRRHEFWMTGVAWRLATHLRAHPCHVLHSWLHYAVMLGAVAGGLAGAPTIIGSLRSERPSRFPWFYPRWQRAIDILTVPLQTTVIANSDAVRRENRRWALIPERKLATIYNGIDFAEVEVPAREQVLLLRRSLNLPLHAPIVGIVGRLSTEKDHATFLQAARLIADVRPEARFLIVGDGPLREAVQNQICRSQLQDHIQILGNRHDALALMRLMDVLVLTSTSEGFPNVLLEATVAGTPAVTTAAGGAAEVVVDGHCGFVVPCGDGVAVAHRVLALMDDPALRRGFADAARQRMLRHFSAGQMATRIQEVYDHSSAEKPYGRVKVCFASPYAYGMLRPAAGLPIGGAEVQICTLARELAADKRFDVSVLTSAGARVGLERDGALTIRLEPLWGHSHATVGQRADIVAASATVTSRTPWRQQCPAVLVPPLRRMVQAWFAGWRLVTSVYWPVRNRLGNLFNEVRSVYRWVRAFVSIGADIYVMRCASPQVAYARLASRLLRRKFVYMIAHEIDVSGAYVRQQGVWGKRFERGLLQADTVVCQHAEQVTLLRTRHGREGRLIRSLCPISALTRPTPADRRMILWMARLDAWKQPEIFVDLAARLPERSFVMVGPTSETDPVDLNALRVRMAGLSNLTWLPALPFEQASRLFQEAMLFVNTSRAEGFPNTFLQAGACGIPIVSWGVDPDLVLERHQFGYCANGDWKKFEHSVRLLCADIELRERLGENGRRYVREHHDPALIAAEYAELFLSLVQKQVKVQTKAEVEAEIC